ncbi:MAG: FAD-binding protein [Roseinatronobacter sp.]
MRPESEDDVAEIVRSAQGPLHIRGGGTRALGHARPGMVLRTEALRGVTLYEPGALTLVVRAGTPLAEVEAILSAEGQRFPFEPSDMRALMGREGVPSVGGMVAANASGPRRIQAGACRDSMIGLRFVDGTGAVIKNGGRVMKNVTGYDLVKLMAGSWGTLGVLTECAFKVLPQPEAEATLISDSVPVAAAVDLMSRALGTPYEVSGAARDHDGRVVLRVEGLGAQVRYRIGALQAALGGDWVQHEGAASQKIWLGLRDLGAFVGQPGDVWRLSVRPSQAAALVERIAAPVVLDWGGGLIWARVPEGRDLRAELGAFSGHATRVRGGAEQAVAAFHPEAAPVAALSARLRAKFDPRGVLNPGLMG